MGPGGGSATTDAVAGATIEVLRFLHEEVQVCWAGLPLWQTFGGTVPFQALKPLISLSILSSSTGPLAPPGARGV